MKNKIQSFVGSRLEGRKGNTQRTSNLSPTNHQRYHRTWGAIFTLVMLFTFAIGQMWGADEVYNTIAVTAQKSNKVTNSTGSILTDNSMYLVSPSALTLTEGKGIDPNKLGVLFKLEKDCNVTLTYENTSSNRTITVKVFECDPNLIPILKVAGTTNISTYIFNTYKGSNQTVGNNEDLAYWYDRGLIKVSSGKYQADDTNTPKYIANSDSKENAVLYTSAGTFVSHNATKNVTSPNVIATSTATFKFSKGKAYAICLQRNSGCFLKSVTFTPVASSFTLSAAVAEASTGYGTVSASSISNISSGADITINNNTLTVGSTTITATPTAQSAQYTYAFANWKLANGNDVPAKVTADLSVVANFTRTPRSYSVTLNTNEGTINAGNVTSYTFGTETTLPTNVTKENNDFKGWYASSDFSTERVYTIAADATGNKEYWAKWEAEAPKHAISYTNLKGQSVDGYPTQYSEGEGIASFDALSDVDGFHFTGWSPDAIPADATDDPFVVTAQWVSTYSVSFDKGAGSGTAPAGFQKWEGAKFNLPDQGDIVAPANKQFLGWKDQDGNKYAAGANYTMPGKAVTLTAYWATKVENVIYSWESPEGTPVEVGGTAKFYTGDTDNSSATNDNRVNYANKPINGDNATQYYTLRLDKAIDYSAEHVRIALNSALKEGDKIAITAYYTKDQTKTVAPKIANGSNEVICSTDNLPNLYGGGTPTTQTKTLNANAEGATTLKLTRTTTSTTAWITKLRIYRESYVDEDDLLTVTFNTNGGSTVNSVQVVSGQTIAKPADPTKAHNRFNEWQLSGSAYNFATPVTANITLDADWTPLYTVTYDANGGSGAMTDAKEYAAGEEVTLKANEFTNSGMEFVAWEVKETESENAVAVNNGKFTMPAAAVTVKATWEVFVPGNYVVYNGSGNDGGSVPVDAVKHGENAVVTVLGNTGSLTKTIGGEPAVFHGWNTNIDMISGAHYEAGDEFAMPDEEVNLYAVWGFAINYNLDGGTINDATYAHWYVSTGTTTSISTPLPGNVTREGYTFGGWYTHNGVGNEVTSINAEYTGNFEGEWALKAKWILSAPIGKAQSIDMEGLVESDGTSAEWQNYLYSHGYSFSTDNVSLDEKKDPSENKAYDNWPYQGLKMKKSGAYVQGTVDAGKLVIIKLGHMAADATVTIGGVAQEDATGLDAAEPAGQPNYYYVENESVLRYETTNDGACVLKAITITDPYTVSFAAHGDADPAALDGHPAVTLPTPTNGTASFLGWFTAETGGTKIGDAGESYTPSADITLHAQWETISTDARLSSITFSSDAGTLVPAWNMELTEYTYTMPYGTTAIPTVIAATANFTHDDYWYIESAATAWGETTIVRGKAVSGDTKAYNIKMEIAPKDGVCLIKGNVGNNTFVIDEEASLLSGTPSKSNVKSESSTYETLTGWKFNSRPAHLGLTLSEGTFQAGDVVEVFVTSEANGGGTTHKMRVFDAADATPAHVLAESAADMVQGANRLVLPATSTSSLYLHRGASGADYENWNPYVAYFAVYRPMNPMLTAMTIDGRTVTINEDAKTATVTIPYEAELAALNVEPTIVWNGAHATTPTTVISHEGAWVLAADGDNTYRIMDKDGDYTDYTITLTRDVKKYTVSFNAQGGSAVQSELVVAGEKLAAAPADPTREDYEFLGWAEAAEGEVVDVTDFVINADKTFYAQWKYENPIKLIIDGTGNTKVLNSEKFYTGATLASGTVNVDDVPYKYATLSSTATTPVQNDKTKLIAYNATTTKTKLMVDVYNSSTSDRQVNIFAAREGSGEYETLATLALNNSDKKHVKTLYYEFNSNANEARTFYISVSSSASSVYFLQVKVIESGEPLKKAGEVGYSLNMNKGRMFADDETIEGVTFDLSSTYKALDGGYVKITSSSTISFDITNPVTLSVEAGNNKTYYVTRGAAGDANATALTGVSEFQLTEGKWFISGGSNEVQLKSIAFSAAKPVYTRENLNPNNIGTLCVQYTGRLEGATLYELVGKNEHNYLVFDEVENNAIQPGYPYIFVPENGNTKVEVYKTNEETVDAPVDLDNGMMGTFVNLSTLPVAEGGQGEESLLWNKYIISNNHYVYVDYTNCRLGAYRAYITSLDDVAPANPDPAPTQNGAPRRRLVMGGNAPAVATDVDNIYGNDTKVQKILINGQLFIIRGDKTYDATGRLVK